MGLLLMVYEEQWVTWASHPTLSTLAIEKSRSFWTPDASVIWFLSGIWLTWNDFLKVLSTEQPFCSFLQLRLGTWRWSWISIFSTFNSIQPSRVWMRQEIRKQRNPGWMWESKVLVQLKVKPTPGVDKALCSSKMLFLNQKHGHFG